MVKVVRVIGWVGKRQGFMGKVTVVGRTGLEAYVEKIERGL